MSPGPAWFEIRLNAPGEVRHGEPPSVVIAVRREFARLMRGEQRPEAAMADIVADRSAILVEEAQACRRCPARWRVGGGC